MTTPEIATPTGKNRAFVGEGLRQARRLLMLLRPHWRRISRGLGLGFAGGAVAMVTPLLSKMLFDNVYPGRNANLLRTVILGIVVVEIASALLTALRGYYTQVVGARVSSELSLLLFNHLQHLPARFFDERSVGEILSRSGDLQRSVSFITNSFRIVLVNGVYLFLVPPLLIAFNWQLAVLALVTVPITTTTALLTGRRLRVLSRKGLEFNAEASAFQFEALSNVRILKAAAAEPEMFRRMKDRLVAARSSNLRTGALGAALGAGNALIRAAGTAIFSWYAWTLIIDGRLTLGAFVAFSAYRGYLTGPITEIASMFIDFQQTTVSLSRFFEYFDMPTEQEPSASITPRLPFRRALRGTIEFKHVHFAYDATRPVLTDVSFQIRAGEIVSLIGRSGAGKSSIMKLILRMYEPQDGTILMDDIPIREFSLPELRGQLGVVWQENTAFRGTLRDNLTLGFESVSDDQLHIALRQAQLEEFVRSLPSDLDTAVAEWGGTLSGGQRQRLAIARAIARANPVLLLDEATSNLDTETERDILRSLFSTTTGRTVLFATHRLAAASLADRIFIVSDGGVSGGLPHAELLESDSRYQSIWEASASGIESSAKDVGSNGTDPDAAAPTAIWS
jgi:ABC-type bacteriocin/lantibiotic exporter with double-glycine peptidase domain